MILLMLLLGAIGYLVAGPVGAAVGICIAMLPAVISWLGDL